MTSLPRNNSFCATQNEPRGKESSPVAEHPPVDTQRLAKMISDALRILRDDQSLSVTPVANTAEVGE